MGYSGLDREKKMWFVATVRGAMARAQKELFCALMAVMATCHQDSSAGPPQSVLPHGTLALRGGDGAKRGRNTTAAAASPAILWNSVAAGKKQHFASLAQV